MIGKVPDQGKSFRGVVAYLMEGKKMADLVSYAVFRKFELGDATFFDLIESRFDRDCPGGKAHGLAYKKAVLDDDGELHFRSPRPVRVTR